jgi:hypothetical protein
VPDDEWQGTPVEKKYLDDFMPTRIEGNGNLAGVMMQALFPLKEMRRLEWQGVVKPPIRPDMDSEQIDEQLRHASGNAIVAHLVELWRLLGASGRVQIHNSAKGRLIRMVGPREMPKGWRGIPTLIADGTGDATLLRAIWPKLKCEVDDWQQLPRPDSADNTVRRPGRCQS